MQVERKGSSLLGCSSGERVSNTWVICPVLRDKLGKLGLIPDIHVSFVGVWKGFVLVWDELAAY